MTPLTKYKVTFPDSKNKKTTKKENSLKVYTLSGNFLSEDYSYCLSAISLFVKIVFWEHCLFLEYD